MRAGRARISGDSGNEGFRGCRCEVTIERLGREGDGIAGALRLPFALPGERWRVAEGAADAARRPRRCGSRRPARISAPAAAARCSMPRTAGSPTGRRETIARALAARGLAAAIRPTLTSPPRSRRRAVFAGRRTRKAAIVGFHGRRSETLVEVPGAWWCGRRSCAALPALARLTAARGDAVGDAAADGDRRAGRARRRRGRRPARSTPGCGARWRRWPRRPTSRGSPGTARSWRLRRPPFQAMGAARVVPPPGAFLQATAEGEAALVAAVREAVGGARRVADLFAGCGTFALPLAARRRGAGGGGRRGDAGGAGGGCAAARRAAAGQRPRRATSSGGRCWRRSSPASTRW